MKKNILFLMILLTSFFIITGCGKQEEKENVGDNPVVVSTQIGDIKYEEPKDYRESSEKLDSVNYQTRSYKYFDFTIEITYRKNKNINDLKQNMNKREQVEFNNIKYRFIEDGGGGTTFDSYYTQHNKDAYIIEFYGNKTDNNFKIMEDFLNTIEFIEQ